MNLDNFFNDIPELTLSEIYSKLDDLEHSSNTIAECISLAKETIVEIERKIKETEIEILFLQNSIDRNQNVLNLDSVELDYFSNILNQSIYHDNNTTLEHFEYLEERIIKTTKKIESKSKKIQFLEKYKIQLMHSSSECLNSIKKKLLNFNSLVQKKL